MVLKNVERGLAVADEVCIAHNLAAVFRESIGAIVVQSDVVIKRKILRRPNDDIRLAIVLKPLWIGLPGPKPGGHESPRHRKQKD